MEVLPSPPVPVEADLRDFQFMPLDVAVLCDSGIAVEATGDEFRAAVLLWCKAWHQVPAGSLPDNDAMLSQYAGYGRVVSEWQKVRAGALRGFVKCSDGRLYHSVIAEKASEAWRKKCEYETKKAAERERKKKFQQASAGIPPENSDLPAERAAPSAGIPPENALKGEGEGEGQGEGDTTYCVSGGNAPEAGATTTTPDDLISAFDAAIAYVWGEASRRRKPHSSDHATAAEWLQSGITATVAGATLRERFARMQSRGNKPPFSMSPFTPDIQWAASADVRPDTTSVTVPARSLGDDDARWRSRLIGFRDRGDWFAMFGAKPGEEGCEAPAKLIAEILPHLAPSAQIIPMATQRAVQ